MAKICVIVKRFMLHVHATMSFVLLLEKVINKCHIAAERLVNLPDCNSQRGIKTNTVKVYKVKTCYEI